MLVKKKLVLASGSPRRQRLLRQIGLPFEMRESGIVYTCPSGQHDDLGISCAMLAWAARHPHLEYWLRKLEAALRPRKAPPKFNWAACT